MKALFLAAILFFQLTLITSAEEFSPDEVVVYKTVDDVQLDMNFFFPEGHAASDQRPAIIFFHGGGWKGGSPSQFFPHCEYLAERGIVAASAQYRLEKTNGTTPQECVKDGKSAMRWLRKNAANYGVDPDRIMAGGGSAGGHVAAATAFIEGFNEAGEDTSISCSPAALVLFNPVFDNSENGYGYDRVQDYWESFSPMHNIRKPAPPTVVFLGTEDHLIPVDTAKEYRRRMEAAGGVCELHIYSGEGHGFFNYKKTKAYNATVAAMDRFLISRGFLNSKAKAYELWEPQPAPNRGHDFKNQTRGRGYPHDPDWESWSYPLGNGNLGANVFGRTDVERIQLTEKTVANGSAYGRGGVTNAGELYLDIGHEDISDYRRALCLDTAIKSVTYQSGGVSYQREYFTSYPDDIMVIRLTADKPGALSFTVRPEIPYLEAQNPIDSKSGIVKAEGDTVSMVGTIDYYQVNFEIQVKVLNEGGKLATHASTIDVKGADSVTLLVAAGTNYELGPHIFLNEPKGKLDPNLYPHEKVTAKMQSAAKLGYKRLKARHLHDYQNLFGRVALNLNSQISELPTSQLVQAYKEGDFDSYLEELLYQYGRYLLIASSRETTLPAHLQGAWSQYESSPWCSGYWHNINVQMNYWGAFSANLAETFKAYLNYFEAYKPLAHRYAAEFVAEQQGEDAVSENPEDNGWIVGTGANAYQISGRSGHSGPGTGAFTSQLLMDYYDFTQDEEFLRETGFPALLQMSKFFDKALKETDDGLLLISPSASPEQKHNGEYYLTEGCTFDQGFVWENHQNVLRAAKDLGIKDPFLKTIRKQIPRLDPILIGSSGQIKEFREEDAYSDIGDPLHRHISHLHTLYPGTLINTSKPEWMEAAAVTLNNRGDVSTGWAMAHRMICWARLRNAERAHDLYRQFVDHKTAPNLWSMHPPFQIDGNFGVMAAVSEMLIQSHEGVIEPIPAIPQAWNDGSFSGMVARGNFELSGAWKNLKLTELTVHSRSGRVCRIKYDGLANAKVVDEQGEAVSLRTQGDDVIIFETQPGNTYRVILSN